MTRLLARLADAALAHPWRLILTVCLPALVLSAYALRVPIDLSFTGILDRSEPEVDRYLRAMKQYELGGNLLLLLEASEADARPEAAAETLDEAVRRVLPVLESDDDVREVLSDSGLEWLEAQLPWLVERPVFDAWLRLVSDPTDAANADFLARSMERLAHDRASRDVRLVEIRMARHPLDVELGASTFFAIERKVAGALAGVPVTYGFSGLPALSAQDQNRTLGILQRLTPLSLLGVLVLFHFLERRFINLAAAIAPLLLAVVVTLGLIGLLLGQLTIMETFFGVTIFGLGIDFAIHLIVRQREERARGLPFEEALRRSLPGTGRGIVAGAVTTAGAFLIVAMAPDPVATHLGLSGGIGLLVCLVLMLALTPPVWVLVEHWREQRGPHRDASAAVPMPVVATLARFSLQRPWQVMLSAALLLVAALAGAPRFRTETDLEQVFNRKVPALDTTRRIQELFGINGAPWIVGVASLAEARRITAAFEAHPLFVRTESLARLLPEDADERRRALDDDAEMIATRLEQTAVLAALGASLPAERREEIELYRTALERLAAARTAGPPTLDAVPRSLRTKLLAGNGDYLVYAYAADSVLDGEEARAQRLAAQSVAPGATGLGALLEAIMVGQRNWVWPVFFGILLFVTLVLLVDLRDVRLVLLALVPVLWGLGMTFGLLCWLGVAFNVMTTMVVPLIIGLGVDDGIHVAHRMRERVDPSLDAAAAAVGRAIVMTTATTSCSFAVLLLTDHPGLESMGLVMLLGLPLCLLASVTAMPALGQLLMPRWPDGTGTGAEP